MKTVAQAASEGAEEEEAAEAAIEATEATEATTEALLKTGAVSTCNLISNFVLIFSPTR